MRFLFFLIFIFHSVFTSAQENDLKAITLQELLNISIDNQHTDTTLKQKTTQIKSAWYDMLYQIHTYNLLQEFLDYLSDIERVTALKYSSGELDMYEASSMLGILEESKSTTAIAANRIEIDRNLLSLYTGLLVTPSDSAFDMYEIDKSFISEYQEDSFNREFEIIIGNKRIELDNLFIKIEYFRNYALNHADITDRLASAKLAAEDIDYISYIHYLSEALQIRLKYFETLNQYNQLAIELENLSY